MICSFFCAGKVAGLNAANNDVAKACRDHLNKREAEVCSLDVLLCKLL